MTTVSQAPTVPSINDSVSMLKRLLDLWRDPALIAFTVPILESRVERGIFALGEAEHAAGMTDAILLLVEKEMFVQTAPLVRLTLECAVTGAWFAVTPGSGTAGTKDAARARAVLDIAMEDLADPAGRVARERTRSVAKSQGTTKSKVSGEKSSTSKVDGEASHFEQRAESLAGGDWFYPYYRLLSEYSHGGAALLEHYGRPVDAVPSNPLGLEYDPKREWELAAIAMGVQAVALITALKAWDDLAPEHPMRDRLDSIAEEMGTTVILNRKVERRGPHRPRLLTSD